MGDLALVRNPATKSSHTTLRGGYHPFGGKMPNDISVLFKTMRDLEERIEILEFSVKTGLVGPGPWPYHVLEATYKADIERKKK
jgi:hypothetical protein